MRMRKIVPSLGVCDIHRSITFYRDFFGFAPVDSYEEEGRLVWCHLRSGGAELMLQQLSAEQLAHTPLDHQKCWVIYISPENIQDLHTALRRKEYKVSEIEQTSYGTREFMLDDPDGYELWVSHPSV